MTELDERSMGTGVATPRYPGDPSIYAPVMHTRHGFNIGRSLPGTNVTDAQYSGALQVFIPHSAVLEAAERCIIQNCDHAQVHPATLHDGSYDIAGRGYWVRGTLESLLALVPVITPHCSIAPVLMDVVGADAYGTLGTHARVVVPFKNGVVGESILNPWERADLIEVLSDGGRRPVISHLDFNGTHYGTTDKPDAIDATLAQLRAMHDTSAMTNKGMTTFLPVDKVNVESYPVRMF